MGRAALLALALAFASACATPVGVTRVDHAEVYRTLTRSALSSDQPSFYTAELLNRHGFERRFEEEPDAVLAELRGKGTGLSADRLFVLAELSFMEGERTHRSEYYLAAVVYALGFLSDPAWRAEGLLVNAVDPRTRMACDLYNIALELGLKAEQAEPAPGQPSPPPEVLLTDRTLALPFGELELKTVPETFLWGGYRFSRFISTAEYKVRGLRNRYRQAGLGASLMAEIAPVATGPRGESDRRRIPPRLVVPVTVTLKIGSVIDGIASGRLSGTIEVHPADASRTFDVNGVQVPLELDPSAAIGYMLEGAPVWDSELGGFFKATRPVFGDGLVMLQPYRPGRVPVVLVHGTASSPARWAEVINELQNDPVLGEHIQVWLFMYNTSLPILYTANLLREALQSAVKDFDPEGRDPALRRMVIMGHSQGGLLTRLMVTDSGTRFWDNVATVPFEQIKAAPEERALLQRVWFFEPQPYVSRVVFLATPHRGSFRVTSLVLNLVRRFVTLPLRLTQQIHDLIRQNPGVFVEGAVGGGGVVTAVDNMNPVNPFVRVLSGSPIAPGVTAHSIIAVKGPPSGALLGKNDGVVRYDSAHLEGVASEKVVDSSHSMQANPETILEIRRILREHLDAR